MLISVRMHMKGVEPLINFRSMIEVAILISSKLMIGVELLISFKSMIGVELLISFRLTIEVEALKLLKSTIEVEFQNQKGTRFPHSPMCSSVSEVFGIADITDLGLDFSFHTK